MSSDISGIVTTGTNAIVALGTTAAVLKATKMLSGKKKKMF